MIICGRVPRDSAALALGAVPAWTARAAVAVGAGTGHGSCRSRLCLPHDQGGCDADFALTQVSDLYPWHGRAGNPWRLAVMGPVDLSGGASWPAGQANINRLSVQPPLLRR